MDKNPMQAYDETVAFNTIVWERVNFGFQTEPLPANVVLDEMAEPSWPDVMAKRIVLKVRGYIYTRKEEDLPSRWRQFKWPSNWWEHFKERWFTDRMLTLWPVKYTVRDVPQEIKRLVFRPNDPPYRHDGNYMVKGRESILPPMKVIDTPGRGN